MHNFAMEIHEILIIKNAVINKNGGLLKLTVVIGNFHIHHAHE